MPLVSTTFHLLRDRKAASALEYSVLAALLAVGLMAGAASVGPRLSISFQTVADAIKGTFPSDGAATTDQAATDAASQPPQGSAGLGASPAGTSEATPSP